MNIGTPALTNLPLASGISIYKSATYSKNQLGEVAVILSVVADKALATGTLLATLPVGYRPQKTIECAATLDYSLSTSGNYVLGTISVNTDGRILVHHRGSEITTIHASIVVFPAAS